MRKRLIILLLICLALSSCTKNIDNSDEIEATTIESTTQSETSAPTIESTTESKTATPTMTPKPTATSTPTPTPSDEENLTSRNYFLFEVNTTPTNPEQIKKLAYASYRNEIWTIYHGGIVLIEGESRGYNVDFYDRKNSLGYKFAVSDYDTDGIDELIVIRNVEEEEFEGYIYKYNPETGLIEVIDTGDESFVINTILNVEGSFLDLTPENADIALDAGIIEGSSVDSSIYNDTIKKLQDGYDTEYEDSIRHNENFLTKDVNNDGYLDLLCGVGGSREIGRLYTCDNKGNVRFVAGWHDYHLAGWDGFYINIEGELVTIEGYDVPGYEIYKFYNYPQYYKYDYPVYTSLECEDYYGFFHLNSEVEMYDGAFPAPHLIIHSHSYAHETYVSYMFNSTGDDKYLSEEVVVIASDEIEVLATYESYDDEAFVDWIEEYEPPMTFE